jgi:hypothetical protein
MANALYPWRHGRGNRRCYKRNQPTYDGVFIFRTGSPAQAAGGLTMHDCVIAVDRGCIRTFLACSRGRLYGKPLQEAKARGEGNVARHLRGGVYPAGMKPTPDTVVLTAAEHRSAENLVGKPCETLNKNHPCFRVTLFLLAGIKTAARRNPPSKTIKKLCYRCWT